MFFFVLKFNQKRFLAAVALPPIIEYWSIFVSKEWKSCGKPDKTKIKSQGAAGRRSGVIIAAPSSLANIHKF